MAKFLGKPTVILRTDSRRISNDSFDEPYSLIVKNYPQTVSVHVDSLFDYLVRWEEKKETVSDFESELVVEQRAIERGIHVLTHQILEALDKVIAIPSPYPKEYRKMIYRAARLMPGNGFDELFSEKDLKVLLGLLVDHETL